MNYKRFLAVLGVTLLICSLSFVFAEAPPDFSTSASIPESTNSVAESSVLQAPETEQVPPGSEGSALPSSEVVSSEQPTAPVQEVLVASAQDPLTSFVTRMYQVVLNRTPAQTEIEGWVAPLRTKQIKGADIIYGFFYSQEYKNRNKTDAEFLADLYLAMFNRTPDATGFETWSALLKDGASRLYIISGFSGSEEYKNLCANFGIEAGSLASTEPRDQNLPATAFVVRLYQYALGRSFDIDGLNNWTASILNHEQTGASLLTSFFYSPEFQSANLSNAEFVKRIYRLALNREPDAEGFSVWLSVLEKGCSRDFVLSGFSNSPEYHALCQSYGITPGVYVCEQPRDKHRGLTEFAYGLYRNLLGRIASEQELNNAVENLNAGFSGFDYSLGIVNSAEYLARTLDDRTCTREFYLALLGREPSDADYTSATNYLTSNSRQQLFTLLMGTSEFVERCKQLTVTPGSINFTRPKDNPIRGIDVAMFQKDIDWTAVKNSGVEFAFIRAVSTDKYDRVYVDPWFYINVRGAKNAGLKVGVYYAAYATTYDEVDKEVGLMLSAMKEMERQGFRFDYPIAVDAEFHTSLGRDTLTALNSYALSLIEQQGYYPILYTYTNYAKNYLNMNQFSQYDVWIANYTGSVSYPSEYTIWQYSSQGSIPGINTNADLDYSYVDYDKLIKTTRNSAGKLWNHWDS